MRNKKLGSEIGKVDGITPFAGYIREQRRNDIIIPVIGVVESPEDFIEFVAQIDFAQPEDVIILRVNSPGGSLSAIDYLLDALGKCKNHIVLEASGIFASAVTLLADYADDIYISDNCEILIHNAVFGEGGKHKDVIDAVMFADKMNKRLLSRYYSGMFNYKEMEQLYEGKQFYMDNEEYLERFNKRQEYLQKKYNSETTVEQEDTEEEPTSVPLDEEILNEQTSCYPTEDELQALESLIHKYNTNE